MKTHLAIVSFMAECCTNPHAEATRLTAHEAKDKKRTEARIRRKYTKNGIEISDFFIVKGAGR